MTVVLDRDGITLHQGDCREVMATLPAESIDCVVTSPPYYGLRDYGLPSSVWGGVVGCPHEWIAEPAIVETSESARWQHTEGGGQAADGTFRNRHARNGTSADSERETVPATTSFCVCGAWLGCLGLEPTPDLFVDHVVDVFREVRRVLRKDGTLWLNIGDSYVSTATSTNAGGSFQAERAGYSKGRRPQRLGRTTGLKPKDRAMIPARTVIALQADGWWIRDEIVWAKSNPMPSSVNDRTTPSHEMVYLLTKSRRYWYDAAAIAEPAGETRPEALAFGPRTDVGYPVGAPNRKHARSPNGKVKVPGGWMVGPGTHGTVHPDRRTAATYQPVDAEDAAAFEELRKTDSRWPRGWAHGADRGHDPQVGRYDSPNGHVRDVGLTRNKRSVWTIPTEPYPEAHFATFPRRLVVPMILAGCRPGGVVLDPFGGSGTVGEVARTLGRRAILIELSEAYVPQAIIRASGGLVDPGPPAAEEEGTLWAPIV